MSSPAFEIASFLDSEDVGSFPGDGEWSISVNRDSISPSDSIAIYDDPGVEIILPDEGLKEGALRIRVRSKDYSEGYSKMEEIYDLLNGVVNEEIGENLYLMVLPINDISGIGRDNNDRYIFNSEYKIMRGKV